MNTNEIIPVYAINLKSRTDRLKNINSVFFKHEGFRLEIVRAIEDSNGGFGLWKTIYAIIEDADKRGDEFVLICEDDHIFTAHFDMEDFKKKIIESSSIGVDVLLGGVSWSKGVVRAVNNLYWVDSFNGTQFMLIFRRFFQKFLALPIERDITVDMAISNSTNHIMVIAPFISIQQEFGYSDATNHNNNVGYVDALFESSMNKFQQLESVFKILYHRIYG